MLKLMPEDHQFMTNSRSQDSTEYDGLGYLDRNKDDSPDSESTESAIGDGEEDPNDPEWIDMERVNRERYKRIDWDPVSVADHRKKCTIH
ncbi:hypothetical protein NQ317_001397 [Molorchus minor]|uniref:Uncharacterized protein n=1 Tax=Molorchus minor TaxID=1323400 RepID=A0ABQ9J5L3_9CUCU|nr:hypothetical protein NQ317_001397 [Molorchus minor]